MKLCASQLIEINGALLGFISFSISPGSGWPTLNITFFTTLPLSTPIISLVLILCSTPLSLFLIVILPGFTTCAHGTNRQSFWFIRYLLSFGFGQSLPFAIPSINTNTPLKAFPFTSTHTTSRAPVPHTSVFFVIVIFSTASFGNEPLKVTFPFTVPPLSTFAAS